MATVGFAFREVHRKRKELDEARKAGLAPAEVDDDGKEINPHIPHYLTSPPLWDINSSGKPSLKHQRKTSEPVRTIDTCYNVRGKKIYQAQKYRKGACENCGEISHNVKQCTERPRKVGAKLTNKNIAPDHQKLEGVDQLDYEGKRDRWNGYDPSNYSRVVDLYELKDEARKKYLKEQKLKSLSNDVDATSDGDEEDEDEAKVDESKQIDFAKVEKRVRTSGGGSTGTVRDLRIREDTAKYLLNLDVNSAYYDPKTRSMREDPLPDADPNEKFYLGDNHYRNSGQALEFKQLHNHSWEVFDKGQDMHIQAVPSQAELSYKCFKVAKEKLKSQTKDAIMEKYGNAAAKDEIPLELLLGQSERQVEYDRAGRIIKRKKLTE